MKMSYLFEKFDERKSCYLKRVEGKFVPLHSTIPAIVKDGALIKSSRGDVEGIEGGKRSVLVVYKDKLYKIKACAFKETRNHRMRGDEPLGGTLRKYALNELHVVEEVKRVLKKEKIPYPLNSVGYFEYEFKHKGENLIAPVFETEDDLRLDVLMFEIVNNLSGIINKKRLVKKEKGRLSKLDRLSEKLYFSFGKQYGGIKRVLDDANFSLWPHMIKIGRNYFTNAHHGNLLVYAHGNELWLAPIDLDRAVRGDGKKVKERQKKEKDGFFELFFSRFLPSRDIELKYHIPLNRPRFYEGFNEGYENLHLGNGIRLSLLEEIGNLCI